METTTPSKNKLGLEKSFYGGAPSTLCTGCGHDSITNHIISALYQTNINPFDLAKMSGIGCSSKTPAYFSSKSFAFNSVHGRMPAVSTGAKLANRNLRVLGISGDGDSASIGIGTFVHLIRRNLPMAYVIENNGVYGLTKGQFSATAEMGAKLKSGAINPFEHIDLCALAIELGCSFVARSFSGDAKQLVPLLEAALEHNGTAVIDVVSPCVSFNNHEGSTKSFDFVRSHNVRLQELGFVQPGEELTADYPEGESESIRLPDGSVLTLRKINQTEHNVHDPMAALTLLRKHRVGGELLTGLFYIHPESRGLVDSLNLTNTPLCQLTEQDLRPSAQALENVLQAYR